MEGGDITCISISIVFSNNYIFKDKTIQCYILLLAIYTFNLKYRFTWVHDELVAQSQSGYPKPIFVQKTPLSSPLPRFPACSRLNIFGHTRTI